MSEAGIADPAPSRAPLGEPGGPLVQAISITFRLAAAALLLLAAVWLAGNIREVPPDTTAIVTRFGRIVQVRGAGLLLGWPGPIEAVRLLPGPERQLPLSIEPQAPAAGIDGGAATGSPPDVAARRPPPPRISPAPRYGSAGSYLTGDGGVVLIDVALTYRITDPAAFMLAESHVAPALNRLFRAATVAAAAHRPLDDFLVIDPRRAPDTRATTSAALREEIIAAINDALAALAADGAPLGVAVTRLDLTAALPPVARGAFEMVLTAGQQADQEVAMARTDATRRSQEAERDRDDLLNVARARAAERLTAAHTDTDGILALEARLSGGARANLLDQVYRDRLAKLMPTIGRITTVEPGGEMRLIMPGTEK